MYTVHRDCLSTGCYQAAALREKYRWMYGTLLVIALKEGAVSDGLPTCSR